MASTYSTSLRLELMATGDQSGTWGDTTNTNLGTLLEQAITGVLSVSQGDAELTLTSTDGASDQARNMVINLTGAMTAGRNMVVPTANKVYLVKNSTTGGFAVTVKTTAGTGVAVAAGTAQWVYCDGTNVVQGLSGTMAVQAPGAVAITGGTMSGVAATSLTSLSSTGSTVGYVGFQTISTEAAAAAGPIIDLYRNSATPAVNDILGQVLFSGEDSAGNTQEYASIEAVVVSPTSTTEASALDFYIQAGGARQRALSLTSTGLPLTEPINLGIAASVGSSALTVALKGADGNDPSASNPVYVPFRNVTAATGTPSYLAITAATSIVISSGSTMGFASGVIGKLWIVGFNDGGTFRLGVVNCLSDSNILALRNGIYSSTAEGGSGGADSAQVIYTGTAVTSKAMTILGYLEATEATAGTWATAPSLVQVIRGDDALPGEAIGTSYTALGTSATGTTTIPIDNTIPQNTEGNQFITGTYTPRLASNLLQVDYKLQLTTSASGVMAAPLFQDSVANALVTPFQSMIISERYQLNGKYTAKAASTSATTFKVRAGLNSAGTWTLNENFYGDTENSWINIVEIAA